MMPFGAFVKPLAVCVVLAASPAVALAADPGSTGPEEAPWVVPPELAWNPAETPAEQNAREIVLEIGASIVPLDDVQLDEFLDSLLCGDRSLPEAELRDRVAAIVRRNERALALIQPAIDRGRLRYETLAEFREIPNRLLAPRMVRTSAELLAAEGDAVAAVEQLTLLVRYGDLFRRADADNYVWYEGVSAQATAVRGFSHLLRRYDVPAECIEQFLAACPHSAAELTYLQNGMRAEFHWLVFARVEGLPDSNRLDDAVVRTIGDWLPREPSMLVTRLPAFYRRSQATIAFLEDHPCPIDKSETFDLAAELYLRAIRGVELSPQGRLEQPPLDFAEEVDCWPSELSLSPLDILSVLMSAEQPEAPQETVAKARRALAAVRNPVGKHVLAPFDPRERVPAYLRCLAEYETARLAIALRLFFDRHGRLPVHLQELIDAGILPELPRDPFGDRIRYSAEERRVWSVGRNGRDDGGRRDPPESRQTLAFLERLLPDHVSDALPVRQDLLDQPRYGHDDISWHVPLFGTEGDGLP